MDAKMGDRNIEMPKPKATIRAVMPCKQAMHAVQNCVFSTITEHLACLLSVTKQACTTEFRPGR